MVRFLYRKEITMALKKCKECGHEVSTKAESCPHCGAKQKRKGIGCLGCFGVILILIFLAIFSANFTAYKQKVAEDNIQSHSETPTYGNLKYAHRTINIRKGPGKSHEVVGHLKRGDVVEVKGIENKWAKVSVNNVYKGYVYEPLLKPNPAVLQVETLIPRSVPGDKGEYYLLKVEENGDIITTLHKRVGASYVGYTKTEINCKTMKIRELGYSEKSAAAIKIKPTKWFDLVQGSSKSDLANYVCKMKK